MNKTIKNKTLSPAQLEQRRNAAKKSTGPRTEEGKAASSRNAIKHGLYAKNTLSHGAFKPCQTTCPHYVRCPHIENGETVAGQRCVDKTHVVQAFDAIIRAIQGDHCEDIQQLAAAEMAANLSVIQSLREDIARRGAVLFKPMIDKNGKAICDESGTPAGEVMIHPGVTALPKLLDQLGINLPQFLATPQAQAKIEQKDEEMQTAANLVSAMTGKFGDGMTHSEAIDVEVIPNDD